MRFLSLRICEDTGNQNESMQKVEVITSSCHANVMSQMKGDYIQAPPKST